MTTHLRSNNVFINAPFDAGYHPIFDAIVFDVHDLGLNARCALEQDDSGEIRLPKIERIIEESRFGIHDLSAVELDAATHLPRFNMPLELGLFLGCRRFGRKPTQEIVAHSRQGAVSLDLSDMIADWLQTTSPDGNRFIPPNSAPSLPIESLGRET